MPTRPSFRDRLASLHPILLRAVSKLSWLPGLLLRVTVGVVFLQSGWGKLHHLDQVTQFFTSLGIPAPHAQAVFVSCVELLGGACVLVGLGTRFLAFPLGVTMVVALVTAKASELTEPSDLLRQIEFLYLVVLAVLMLQGAGAVSLDRLFLRWLERDRSPAEAQVVRQA